MTSRACLCIAGTTIFALASCGDDASNAAFGGGGGSDATTTIQSVASGTGGAGDGGAGGQGVGGVGGEGGAVPATLCELVCEKLEDECLVGDICGPEGSDARIVCEPPNTSDCELQCFADHTCEEIDAFLAQEPSPLRACMDACDRTD